MIQNIDLMRSAKASLRGSWGKAALATLLVLLVISISSLILSFIGQLILSGPMMLGYALFVIDIKKNGEVRIERLFDGFKDFLRVFLAYLVITILVTLGALLLIIPGIIISIACSMTYFILAEDKEISAIDAIRQSRDMMRGYKWKYFCLMLRFFGWILLSILTFGILLLWIYPYMMMASLNFYYDIKAHWETKNNIEVFAVE